MAKKKDKTGFLLGWFLGGLLLLSWFELITRSREGLFVSPGYTYGSTTWWTLRNPADISSGTRTHRMPAVDPNFQGEIDYTLQDLVTFQDGRFYFSYYPIPT